MSQNLVDQGSLHLAGENQAELESSISLGPLRTWAILVEEGQGDLSQGKMIF